MSTENREVSEAQPSQEDAKLRPFRELLGEAGLLAAALGMLVALPGAFRGSAGGALAWVALAGCCSLVLGPLIVTGQRARFSPGSAAPLVGVLLAVGPLMLFGQLLEAKTHHRPLGAATFGIISLGLVLASAAGVSALQSLVRRSGRERLARVLLIGLALIAALVAGRQLLLGLAGGSGLSSHLMDGALLLALPLALAGSGKMPHLPPIAARVGRVLWPVVVVAGLALVALRPELAAALREQAPVLLGPGAWFAG